MLKIRPLSLLKGRKRKKKFKKVLGVKCRDKPGNKLSQKEKVAKTQEFNRND